MNDALPTLMLCGFKINPLTKAEFLSFIEASLTERRRAIMTNLNLHAMVVMYKNSTMARLLSRRDVITTIDGRPITWLARLRGYPLNAEHRYTSLDYIDELFTMASTKGWKIYYVGGTEDVIRAGIEFFTAKYPKLKITGENGYFPITGDFSDKEAEILSRAAGSDILIVGMGMPRQEEWVTRIESRTDVPVFITIGAMMEYYTGSLAMPPRWLGPLGLEGVFRLITAPRRLGYRYLVEPFVLLFKLISRQVPRVD